MKKSLTLLLVLCMVLGLLAGCEKDKDKGGSSKPKIVKGSMQEMAEAMTKVDAGTARLEMDMLGMMTMTFDLTFDTKAQKFAIGFGYSQKDYEGNEIRKIEPTEMLRVVGGNAYINLDNSLTSEGIASAMGDRELGGDLKLGWFKIPLPDDLPKSSSDSLAFVNKLMTRLDGAFKSASVREEADGNCSYTFETAEDYKNLIIAVREFVDQDFKDLVKNNGVNLQSSVEDIDMNAYANKLIDAYKDDVRSIVEEYGDKLGVTKAQFDELMKEVEKQDFQALWKQYVEKELSSSFTSEDDIDKIVDELIREIDRELQDEDFSGDKDTRTTVRIEADNEGYTMGLRVAAKDDDRKGDFKLSLRLIPENASVSAPSGTKDLKELADLVFPAYAEYVNKSQIASDISELSDLLAATEKIAVDPEFDLAPGTEMIVTLDDNEVELSIEKSGTSADRVKGAIDEWNWLIYFDSFRTDSMKKARAEFVGTLQMDGNLVWTLRSANNEFSKLFESTSFTDFRVKFDINP